MTGAAQASSRLPRIVLVDGLRGLAILAMAAYHFGWDLFYLGVITTDITTDPVWVTAQRLILGSFVFLAGVSLVLAHRDGIRWRAFWRREAILAAAALAVSLGTFIAFGPYFSWFGVLHALALFSLLALPFLSAPLWLVVLVAVVVVGATLTWSDPAFIDPWLSWIGFWPVSPATVDLVPVFPWFGVCLAGVVVMRLVLGIRAEHGAGGGAALAIRDRMLAWRGGTIARTLAIVGRWSLVVYLLHQPILYGALSGALALLPPPPAPPPPTQAQEFALSCQPGCENAGAPAQYCTAYCACALETIARNDLWDALAAEIQSDEEARQTQGVIDLCRTKAEGTE